MSFKISYFLLFLMLLTYALSAKAGVLSAKKDADIRITDKSKIIAKALLAEVGVKYKQPDKKKKIKPVPPDKKKKKKVTPVPPDKKKKKKKVTPVPPDKKKKKKKEDADRREEDEREKQYNADKRKREQQYLNTKQTFEKQYQETLERWEKERKEFMKRVDIYKKNLVQTEILAPRASLKRIPLPAVSGRSTSALVRGDYHIIPGAFDVPIRDQGRRGTCAAFTAIRAIETVLAQYEVHKNLSEQYFYWSSKPNCQRVQCSRGGSWFGSGMQYSKKSGRLDIPTESDCPYSKQKVKGNETQIPLQRGCYKGTAKTLRFSRIYNSGLTRALTNNHPVLAAFKLSPNFYRTRGFITYADSIKKGSTDSHSAGHAILLVGYVKLPEKYHRTEGKVCYITANSWSEGWGKGGYGCLTEKWVDKHTLAHMTLGTVEIDE
ncbi:MAG: hypothetical protein GY866_39050 [Proteobacteria bacterium]|nr:hypothetical protein [Pseudomonadota bacterium]